MSLAAGPPGRPRCRPAQEPSSLAAGPAVLRRRPQAVHLPVPPGRHRRLHAYPRPGGRSGRHLEHQLPLPSRASSTGSTPSSPASSAPVCPACQPAYSAIDAFDDHGHDNPAGLRAGDRAGPPCRSPATAGRCGRPTCRRGGRHHRHHAGGTLAHRARRPPAALFRRGHPGAHPDRPAARSKTRCRARRRALPAGEQLAGLRLRGGAPTAGRPAGHRRSRPTPSACWPRCARRPSAAVMTTSSRTAPPGATWDHAVPAPAPAGPVAEALAALARLIDSAGGRA